MLLTKFYVLKERQIVVKDTGHPHCISWHVADLTRGGWLGKAGDVEGAWRTSGIGTKFTFHRIAHDVWSCVDSAASEICDWRTSNCACSNLRGSTCRWI